MSKESVYFATVAFSFYPTDSSERVNHLSNEKIDTSLMDVKVLNSLIASGKIRETAFDTLSSETEFSSLSSKLISILAEIEKSFLADLIKEKNKDVIKNFSGIKKDNNSSGYDAAIATVKELSSENDFLKSQLDEVNKLLETLTNTDSKEEKTKTEKTKTEKAAK